MDTQLSGRTIQLFLVDGNASGLIIASIHGWTGSVLVSSQSSFDKLLARPEVDRTGVYIFYGPDPENPMTMRAYIGEADSVKDRIDTSAKNREFWETVVVITTSDEAINKGHGRYLEARLIEMASSAGRVNLDNGNEPSADRKRLSEADRANMEAFLDNIKVILPVVGLDLLKPKPILSDLPTELISTPLSENSVDNRTDSVLFEIRHRSGVKAYATEIGDEFVVLKGAQALKDPGYTTNSYEALKNSLLMQNILTLNNEKTSFEFSKSHSFKSPSAAASVILDRNANGRTKWYVVGSEFNYHDWQEEKAKKMIQSNL